jgi:hypothetical protein
MGSDQAPKFKRDPDLPKAASCPGGRWCERADALPDVEGIHVSSVTATGTGLVLRVETGETGPSHMSVVRAI